MEENTPRILVAESIAEDAVEILKTAGHAFGTRNRLYSMASVNPSTQSIFPRH